MVTDAQLLTNLEAPPAFHLLAKPTGAICNLDCEYCFFLSKEMLYPGSRFRMADDLLETYLRQLIEAHAGSAEVTVAWQGGEPTMMGPGLLPALGGARRAAPDAAPADRVYDPDERHPDRRGMGRVLHGARLPGRVSIDGPKEIRDTYRVDKGGKGSFDLTAGRAPSELLHTYVAEDVKRGRNESCTCGSGRKWKHCHGAP